MKRLLWCLCLCSLCPMTVIGCGDDSGGGDTNEDGGVAADLDAVEADIEDIQGSITGLTDDLGGVGDDLGVLDNRVGMLAMDLDGRLDDLETPDILSCSVADRCTPDGLKLTTDALVDIVQDVCEHEVDCCQPAELNLKFGPGIESVDDCVDLFNGLVENGDTPQFGGAAPYIVNQVIMVVRVLNDPDAHVELNLDGIAECHASLQDHECPEYTEPEEGTDECVVPAAGDEDPCAVWNLVTGLQQEGGPCSLDAAYGFLPECADGLFCSLAGSREGINGICASLPIENDFCQTDQDCDPVSGESPAAGPLYTGLYCNQITAQCTALGAVGDDCEFIDPSFTFSASNPFDGNYALSQDCMPNLTCSPLTNTCIDRCTEGRFCSNSNFCPVGQVCNLTEIPELDLTFTPDLFNYTGVCTVAIDAGDDCTYHLNNEECASGECGAFDNDADTDECAADLIEAGEDCGTDPFLPSSADPTCESNFCDSAGQCAALCNCNGDDCEEYGDNANPCADGFYCDYGNYNELIGSAACEPVIPTGTVCDVNVYHESCGTGFCDSDPGDDDTAPFDVCRPKQTVPTNAPCTTGADEECPNNQYCNAAAPPVCKPYLAVGANCDLTDITQRECAAGTVCVDDTTDTCQAKAGSGDPCTYTNILDPVCEDALDCIDIDGDGAGLVSECYDYYGGYANGVYCGGNDSNCASGWCQPNAPVPTSYACAAKVAEGEVCDTADQTQDTCAEGLFCNHAAGLTAGKCAEQKLPGQACKPFFNGLDCLNGYDGSGYCYQVHDQFLCNQSAQPLESLFCDGQ